MATPCNAALSPAEVSDVAFLQAERDRLYAWAEATPDSEEEELARRISLADAVEDCIRQLPCTSHDVAIAHMRIITRDTALGQRFNASVDTGDLADGVLAYFGERR